MSEFEVAGVIYRAGKLEAFKQFHVVRRLTPIFAALKNLKFVEDAETGVKKLDLANTDIAPIAEALGSLSDEDSEYIINTCMNVCQRRQEAGWMKVRSNNVFMFQDIDMNILLQLTWNVITENFAGFFSEAPRQNSGGGAVSRQV